MIHKHNYVIYDIETSGLGTGTLKEPKAIVMEFAAIMLSPSLEELGRLEFYIKPYIENPQYAPGAFATHNIRPETTVNEGITAKEAIVTITKFFKDGGYGARKKPILVGHNIDKFDTKFMVFLFSMFKQDFNSLYEFSRDTLHMAHLKYGHEDRLENFQLSTCCAEEDISIVGAHRAMKDVEANTKLFIKYMTDFRLDSSNVSGETVEKFREKFHF